MVNDMAVHLWSCSGSDRWVDGVKSSCVSCVSLRHSLISSTLLPQTKDVQLCHTHSHPLINHSAYVPKMPQTKDAWVGDVQMFLHFLFVPLPPTHTFALWEPTNTHTLQYFCGHCRVLTSVARDSLGGGVVQLDPTLPLARPVDTVRARTCANQGNTSKVSLQFPSK